MPKPFLPLLQVCVIQVVKDKITCLRTTSEDLREARQDAGPQVLPLNRPSDNSVNQMCRN